MLGRLSLWWCVGHGDRSLIHLWPLGHCVTSLSTLSFCLNYVDCSWYHITLVSCDECQCTSQVQGSFRASQCFAEMVLLHLSTFWLLLCRYRALLYSSLCATFLPFGADQQGMQYNPLIPCNDHWHHLICCYDRSALELVYLLVFSNKL